MFKKYILVLFFSITLLIAMENDKATMPNKKLIFTPTANTLQANTELLKIIALRKMEKLQEEDWKNIQKCLKNGADPNLKNTDSLQTPLIYLAAKYYKKDLFEYLLQLGAHINADDVDGINGWTMLCNKVKTNLLGWALRFDFNCETIKILCQAGASLINVDDYNHTAFHWARDSEENIKTLMTHIRFDSKIKNTIKTALLIFNRLNYSLPPEIQIYILSKLLSEDYFHLGLYKKYGKKNYQLELKLVNKHVERLKQILQIKNNNNHTAKQQLIMSEYMYVYYKTDIRALLLKGTKLKQDLALLNEKYPNLSIIPKENLALQILENHYKL